MVRLLILVFVLIGWLQTSAQQFHGKKCAVVLTYDDALNVHLDNAVPLLDSLGFKGTFYLSGYFPGMKARIEDWRKAAARGHELGNHTIYHPCIGDGPGREWVSKERNLNSYSIERIVSEINMMNIFLQAIDGKTQRTFAYPCGDMTVRDSSFAKLIANDFVASRGVRGEMLPSDKLDFTNVGSYAINGHSGEYMSNLVKDAIKNRTVLVFLFHGVGGEHPLNVGLKEHRQLLLFLKQHESEIWVAPFVDVMSSVKASGSNTKSNSH